MSSVVPPSSEPSIKNVVETTPVSFRFDNTYPGLPERFYGRVKPTPVAGPRLIRVNVELAGLLGLNPKVLASPEGVQILAGNHVAVGSEPLAQAYAGHQFGHFVPQLGDGRAILLGEVIGQDGRRYDIQLKGSGRTPFSRGGDGRAALGPVLREYIVSEAMAALGVPSTRALAAVLTGERVMRETVLPGAVLTRVASSHLRIGTFQYFAARGDVEGIRALADYAIARHYPEAAQAKQPYRALLKGVIGRQARLIAQWMLLGFVHGVMNTDNTSISGETIDFGPCAFMEAYDPQTVFSSIDRNGRYAYANQPRAAQWNLTRFAETLLPLLLEEVGSEDATVSAANEAIGAFEPEFAEAHDEGMRLKVGLQTEQEGDAALIADLLQRMQANEVDFTSFFRRLCDAADESDGAQEARALFSDPVAYDQWSAGWRRRLGQDPGTPKERADAMRKVNPAYIPRNHLVQEVIDAALNDNFEPFEELIEATSHPFEQRPAMHRFLLPAQPEQRILQTFCGT